MDSEKIDLKNKKRQSKTIEISFAEIEIPIRPDIEVAESNRLNLKMTRSQTNTVYGILYALQGSGEKMADGSAPRLPLDALRWILEKIGEQQSPTVQL